MADEITKLLQTASYRADSIPTLEKYVESGGAYNADANRALCKLYQFNPDKLNEKMVALILMKSMMEFPSTDLLALLCIVPEKVQESEAIANIISCYELLDSCKFKEFWTSSSKLGPSFDAAKLKQGIVDVLALSYRAAPVAVVKAALNTDKVDASHPKIESVTADQVLFVASADNTKRTSVFQEGVKFSAICDLIAASQ